MSHVIFAAVVMFVAVTYGGDQGAVIGFIALAIGAALANSRSLGDHDRGIHDTIEVSDYNNGNTEHTYDNNDETWS